MPWATTGNNGVLKLDDIPDIDIKEFRSQIIKNNDKRVILFFGYKYKSRIKIITVLADDDNSKLLVASAMMGEKDSYPSLTIEFPAFHLFERELFEDFGVKPEGHPWLKPVRYGFNRFNRENTMHNFPFFKMAGEQIHEVAVGPVHAGVIEPGHFRFQCHGEKVHHLEIQLGYQNRGIEDMMLKVNHRFRAHLSESIAGDSVIAHVSAYSALMESLCGCRITRRAQAVRGIMLELERIAVHIGDLGALAGDIAYLQSNSIFGALRTHIINTALAVCGSRFGRSIIRPGGVLYDIDEDLNREIGETLQKILKEVNLAAEAFFSNSSVLARLEQTGVVTNETAKQIGMVGPSARASGVSIDVRTDHPYRIYRNFPLHKITMPGGDVFSRAYIRFIEIRQSIQFILEVLENMPEDTIVMEPLEKPGKDSFTVSLVEGWRGETVHAAVTGKEGLIRYKIKDPSFNNWYGLALAVRGNGISDFPLSNKSFNLSYSGHDL